MRNSAVEGLLKNGFRLCRLFFQTGLQSERLTEKQAVLFRMSAETLLLRIYQGFS